LADARTAADAARRQIREGKDPSEERKAAKAVAARAVRGTVGAVAREWLAFKGKSWAPATKKKAGFVVETYILPALGRERIDTLGSPAAAAMLRRVAAKAPVLARNARQYLQGIVAYAIEEGLREDGRVLMLGNALPKTAGGHIAAADRPDELAAVLAAVHKYPSPIMRAALLMTAYTAQRPQNIVSMRWSEIHTTKAGAEWRIPAERMKMRAAHIVPLPKQARAILAEMEAHTAGREFVFPPLSRQQNAHLHRDALSKALRSMGFQGRHATHGFRASFRTLARERLDVPGDVLESHLGHAKKDKVAAAYDRATHMPARELAVQRWADYLDGLTTDGKVTPFRKSTRSKPAAA
jgi:integrase